MILSWLSFTYRQNHITLLQIYLRQNTVGHLTHDLPGLHVMNPIDQVLGRSVRPPSPHYLLAPTRKDPSFLPCNPVLR